MVTSTVFSTLINDFNQNISNTIATGSANMISLISPLMAVCFTIYVLLICWSYWRGNNDEPINDFLFRMAGWAAVLAFGMNIQLYSEYVVPFVNGVGEQIAGALTAGNNPTSGLDNLLSAYINAAELIYKTATGFKIIPAVSVIFMMAITAIPFMCVAVAYLVLAKFALSLLLALGPLFIALALFPATRSFFQAWTAQCANYIFLTALFGAACAIEVSFATSLIPDGNTIPTPKETFELVAMGVTFLVISLNLPGLACSLAGGVGISTMTGKFNAAGKIFEAIKGKRKGGGDKSGGSIDGK